MSLTQGIEKNNRNNIYSDSRSLNGLNIPTPSSVPSSNDVIRSSSPGDIIRSNNQGINIKPLNYEQLPFSAYPNLHIDTSVSPTTKMETPPAPGKTPSPHNKNIIVEGTQLSIPTIHTSIIPPPKLPTTNLKSPPRSKPITGSILRSPSKAPPIISPSMIKPVHSDISRSISSPLKSPPKYRTMIPISTPTGNNVSDNFTTPRIRIREDIYKKTPPKVDNLAIPHVPQIPHIKIQPIGEIRGRSPAKSQQIIAPPVTIQPQQRSWFDSIQNNVPVFPQRPNYNMMTHEESSNMRTIFSTRFSLLRTSFPQWGVQIPEESSSLDHWHDVYEGYVKQIVISMNKNTWKVYLVIFFFATQACCSKFFNIKMDGYALKQCVILNQYDQLLVQLGEKYYLQGPSNWPVELSILSTACLHTAMFLAIKFIASYAGGEAAAESIHSVITQLLSGADLNTQVPQRDEHGLPSVPQPNTTGDIASSLGQLANNFLGNGSTSGAGGGGFNIQSFLTNIMAATGSSNSPQADPRVAPVRNVVFAEDD